MTNITELRKKLDGKEITKEELFSNSLNEALRVQNEYNAFVTIIDKPEFSDNKSLLSDIPFAIKDNFSTKNILTTGSSNILKNYVPVFNSTVYQKLLNSGAVLLGKTCLDELAMGGTGTTGHTGKQYNPWDKTRIAGGSSSGSAIAVSTGVVPFAIGSDTGDSIRRPASYTGIVGFKPTYGRISRYGLFPFASSLDHVGVMARNVFDAALVTDILKGYDEKDMTSLPNENKKYSDLINKDIKGKKLFYIKEIVDKSLYDDKEIISILDNFYNTIETYKSTGVEIEEVHFDKTLLSAIYATYFTIACAEATSNNSNLTGIHFGSRENGKTPNELMMNTRTKGFSELIKRRFVIGSYVLQEENKEKLYLNACRARNMIVTKMNEFFEKYDGMILPTTECVAPHFDDSLDTLSDKYLVAGNHLIIANFGGYPSITIPSGFVDNMPIGISITCKQLNDDLALNLAYKLEEKLPYKDMIVGDKIC